MNTKYLGLALTVVMALLVAVVRPAYAGPLTSAAFTVSGPYGYTSASNTAYTWAFATATSSALGRVSMSVPAGTKAISSATRFLDFDASPGNYVSTPDTVANSVTGDIDMRAKIAPISWANWGQQPILAKWGPSTNMSYWFGLENNGRLLFMHTANGSSTMSAYSSTLASLGFADGATTWVRVTYQASTGSVAFYTSTDGASWTSAGSTSVAPSAVYNGTSALQSGYDNDSDDFGGEIYYAELRNGINGTVVASMDPSSNPNSALSWSASTGETWAMTRSGSYPVDVAATLTVASVSGLPTNMSSAYLRLNDLKATYQFAPTSVAANATCNLTLLGFVNTSIAGAYASTIDTLYSAGDPLVIDSVTTNTVAFTDAGGNVALSLVVEPQLTFTIANNSTACNGEPNFVSSAGAPTALTMGTIGVGVARSVGQTLSVTSNAGNGFSVSVRGAQSGNNLRSAVHDWADVAGTYSSPSALGSGEVFGYTFHDDTSSTSVANPSLAKFIQLDATDRAVMGSATMTFGSGCVSYTAQAAAATAAGDYTARVFYTAMPQF